MTKMADNVAKADLKCAIKGENFFLGPEFHIITSGFTRPCNVCVIWHSVEDIRLGYIYETTYYGPRDITTAFTRLSKSVLPE